MFKREEIPSFYVEDLKTLHHDIGLVKRSDGSWDLWFGQDEVSERYKNKEHIEIIDGDIVSATELHSLQVGIIISCLTSWNYLNRTDNPVYTDFGNRAYELLKKNKGVNTQYKIKHFFIECLNRMRRVYSVEYLNVDEVVNNPYMYKVTFKVLSITNTLVDGEFYLNTDVSKNTSVIDVYYNHPYTSVSNPLYVECVLKNEYGSFIEGELIYIYIKNDNDTDFKFYGVTESTNYNGSAYVTIPPEGLQTHAQLMFVFRGNSTYNPAVSKIIDIQVVQYYIKSRYTYKKSLDDDGNEIDVVDKHVLYIEDSSCNVLEKFRLGELLSDYVDINNINLTDNITKETIESNYKSDDYTLEYFGYDENDKICSKNNKLFMIPSNINITGTSKKYYKGYVWNSDGTKLVLAYEKIQLNTTKPYETHFLIDDGDNGLFEIDFDDGHLYYQIELYDNEF